MARNTGLSRYFKPSATTGLGVTVKATGLDEVIEELGKLGDDKWVDTQIGLSIKDALKPALQYIKRALPKVTGQLADAMTITNRTSKGRKDRSIRVGVDSQAEYVRKNKKGHLINAMNYPAKYITMVEYGANGRGGYRIINNAYSALATKEKVEAGMHKFMKKRIAKRIKFLRKGLK